MVIEDFSSRAARLKASSRPAFVSGPAVAPEAEGGLVILQVIPRLQSGGAERTTVDIARAVVAEGGRALVASRGGRMVAELASVGGELIRMRAQAKDPLTILWNGFRLAHIARAEGVELIHARSRAPAFSALIAARLAGVPFVTTVHGLHQGRTAFKRWYNAIMVRGTQVIANSEFTAAHVAKLWPKAAPRVVVIPRGVDLARFDPDAIPPARSAALRRAWGASAEDRIVLLPGRLTPWKGQTVLLDAMARLGDPKRIIAVLVGDTQSRRYREALLAKAEKLGLGTRLRLVGHCDDMPAAYRAADVVVSTSTEPEAFGRVVVEAQAMGALVIASDLGAVAETVREGVEATGFRVKAGDADALARALREAFALSADARAAIARRATAHVRGRFSVEAMTSATLAVYHGLIDPDRRDHGRDR